MNDFDNLYMTKFEGTADKSKQEITRRNAPGKVSRVLLYNCWKPAPTVEPRTALKIEKTPKIRPISSLSTARLTTDLKNGMI